MSLNLHPKCANPTCTAAFAWFSGGKLFRFHRHSEQKQSPGSKSVPSHHVEHFWLCERCALVYTLDYDPERGVSIRMLWPELPAAEKQNAPAIVQSDGQNDDSIKTG